MYFLVYILFHLELLIFTRPKFSIRLKTINLLEIIKVKPLKMFWLEKKTFRGEQKTSEKKRLSSSSLFISFSLYLNNKNGIWKDKAGTEQIANSSFVRIIKSNIYSEMSDDSNWDFSQNCKKWGNHPIYVCSSFIKRTGRENGKLRENMFDHMLWLECLWFNMTTNLNMRRFIIEVVMT